MDPIFLDGILQKNPIFFKDTYKYGQRDHLESVDVYSFALDSLFLSKFRGLETVIHVLYLFTALFFLLATPGITNPRATEGSWETTNHIMIIHRLYNSQDAYSSRCYTHAYL